MLPISMVLSLVLPLVMIPKLDSKAYYVSNGDLLHTYDGLNFFFDFEDDLPE